MVNKLNLKIEKVLKEQSDCYLCGGSDLTTRRESVRYEIPKIVYECNYCKLVYLFPLEDNSSTSDFYRQGFRDLPRQSIGMSSHDTKTIMNTRMDQAYRRLKKVKPYVNKNTKLLEVGCAAGSFIKAIKPLVRECFAVELDSENADFVRKKLNIEVFEKPIENLNSDKYDIICMWHVLEHVNDPIKVVKKLMSMLNKNGVLFIEVPNIFDPLLTLYKLEEFHKFYYQSPHLYYFSPTTLEKIIHRAGYKPIIHNIQIYGIMNHLRWLIKKKPQKFQEKKQSGFNIFGGFYRILLKTFNKTDTLFAIIKKTNKN